MEEARIARSSAWIVCALISAWALLAVPMMPLATHKFFPWYLTWAWSAALLRWTRGHRALLVWLLPVSLLLALLYTVSAV